MAAPAQSAGPANEVLEAKHPAATAEAARPARELDSAAPGLPELRPAGSLPSSSDQRVAKLEQSTLPAATPTGPSVTAREPSPAGSPAIAIRPPDQGSLVGSDKQVVQIRPFPAMRGPPLQDQGPLRADRIENIVRYVEQYDGGDCFYVAPVEVSETTARLEGYGASDAPFRTLNDAFLHQNGYEATIDVRLVAPAQCAAVTFLGRLHGVSAPHLRIDSTRLSRGEPLTGTVDGYREWNIALLLATDLGVVQNLSRLLEPEAAGKTFTIRPADLGKASAGQPQLLIAIATLQPSDLLRFDGSVTADRFFPALLSEAERANQPLAAMARYFKLEP
jgi:serine/threonine-protein kinase